MKNKKTIVRCQPSDGRRPTVTVGFPGMIGSLDVINDCGIALSFNQLGFGRAVPKEPIFLTMRRIAENCTTFHEVHEAIMTCPPGVPFIYSVIFDFEGDRFFLASGSTPAAKAKYREFPLFPGRK